MNGGEWISPPASLDDALLRAELRSLSKQGADDPIVPQVPHAGPLRCRLGRHRMQYAGVTLGQRIECCERCGSRRLAA